jgi:hypothetical protein
LAEQQQRGLNQTQRGEIRAYLIRLCKGKEILIPNQVPLDPYHPALSNARNLLMKHSVLPSALSPEDKTSQGLVLLNTLTAVVLKDINNDLSGALYERLEKEIQDSFDHPLIRLPAWIVADDGKPSFLRKEVHEKAEAYLTGNNPHLTDESFREIEQDMRKYPSASEYFRMLQILKTLARLLTLAFIFTPGSILPKKNISLTKEQQGELDSWIQRIYRGEILFVEGQEPLDFRSLKGLTIPLGKPLHFLPPSMGSQAQMKVQGLATLLGILEEAVQFFVAQYRAEPRSELN